MRAALAMTWAQLVSASLALMIQPPQQLMRVRRSAYARPAAIRLSADPNPEPLSWQEELESVLSPQTPQADREVLLRDLLARGSEIAGDVTGAVSSGNLDALVPSTSKSRQLLEDLETVQRQVTEDLLPQVLNPNTLQDVAADVASTAQEASQRGPAAVASALQDPARVLELVQKETVNAFSRTPEGLETPPYKLIRKGSGYELREYPSYGVAATQMGSAQLNTALTASRSFRALASFIFGGNAQAENIGMTTPVRVDVRDSTATMAFVLPSKYSASTAPAPSDPGVFLQQLEVQTLATIEFTGFATDGEVARQCDRLLAQLRRDGIAVPDDGRSYTIFQYNPPYTLPWLRRNELAMPVSFTPAPTEEGVEAADPIYASGSGVEEVDVMPRAARNQATASSSSAGNEFADDDSPSDVDDSLAEEASDSSPSDID